MASDSTPDSTRTPSPTGRTFRQTVVSSLTKIAHGTTPFITTFLLIHLSAPALANLGGSSLASQAMLLGREYYQTPFGEKYLVLGPLTVHALVGITKRLLSRKPRPWNILSITAYSSLLLFLPVHYLTHRFNPTDISAPIFAVGPAQLDFEFVKVGLQTWPVRSWVMYTGLVGCVSLHAAEGVKVIWNTWVASPKSVARWNAKIASSVLALSVLPVISGLLVVSREPLMTFSSLATRFQAAFTKSYIYHI